VVVISVIKHTSAKERLVLALDVDNFESAEDLVFRLRDYVGIFKVGSQLFTSEGAKIINMINKAVLLKELRLSI